MFIFWTNETNVLRGWKKTFVSEDKNNFKEREELSDFSFLKLGVFFYPTSEVLHLNCESKSFYFESDKWTTFMFFGSI